MKAVIYARVSLPSQHIATQLLPLRELAVKRGLDVVAEYEDRGISGTKARRPGLDALMADARRHKFSVIVVAAFDRIARSVKHFLAVLDELDSLGIQFISQREAIDTSGPMGRLFLTLIGSIAELEGQLIRERIRQGMARRRLEGYRLGRAPLDVDHQSLVRDRMSGVSLTQVAKKYSVSRASVVRFSKQAKLAETLLVGDFQPAQVTASVECVA